MEVQMNSKKQTAQGRTHFRDGEVDVQLPPPERLVLQRAHRAARRPDVVVRDHDEATVLAGRVQLADGAVLLQQEGRGQKLDKMLHCLGLGLCVLYFEDSALNFLGSTACVSGHLQCGCPNNVPLHFEESNSTHSSSYWH